MTHTVLYLTGFKSSNVIYFTTITKQVLQLILIMLVGTDVCVRTVFVWEETGVPGGNPPVWLGDQWTMTISHADAGYRQVLNFTFPHICCCFISYDIHCVVFWQVLKFRRLGKFGYVLVQHTHKRQVFSI
mgnify:CR=1 FL=1